MKPMTKHIIQGLVFVSFAASAAFASMLGGMGNSLPGPIASPSSTCTPISDRPSKNLPSKGGTGVAAEKPGQDTKAGSGM